MTENKKVKELNILELEIDGEVKTYTAKPIKVRQYRQFQKLNDALQGGTEAEYSRLKEVYGDEMGQVALTQLATQNVYNEIDYEDNLIALLVDVFSIPTIDDYFDGVSIDIHMEIIEAFVMKLAGSTGDMTQEEKAKDFLQKKAQK